MSPEQTTERQPGAAPSGKDGSTNGRGRPWWRRAIFFGCGLAVAAVLAVVLFGGRTTTPTATAVEPGISTAAAKLLQLTALKGTNAFPAKNFTLTDQYGRATSLDQFRGKVVLLAFNDDRCKNLCTLYAQSVAVAERDLGSARKHVVFLSVNVNASYPQVRYVKTWTDSHGLGHFANWEFTTGTPARLRAVWKEYGTVVIPTKTTGTVDHGTALYFVDPHGTTRAVAAFGTNAANTALYGHDIAQLANDLLPAGEQTAVRGPVTQAPTHVDAAVGARAPALSLPSLRPKGGAVSLAKLRGRYAVVNFWSSTCTACVPELPHMEAAYRHFGGHVAFVGVDVSDTARRARSFAAKAGVTYPLASDTSGSAASDYKTPGLPFTAIISPSGKLLVRHPGAMTTEQLEYVLQSLDSKLAPTGSASSAGTAG